MHHDPIYTVKGDSHRFVRETGVMAKITQEGELGGYCNNQEENDGTVDMSVSREWEKVVGFWICCESRGNGICWWSTCGIREEKGVKDGSKFLI